MTSSESIKLIGQRHEERNDFLEVFTSLWKKEKMKKEQRIAWEKMAIFSAFDINLVGIFYSQVMPPRSLKKKKNFKKTGLGVFLV